MYTTFKMLAVNVLFMHIGLIFGMTNSFIMLRSKDIMKKGFPHLHFATETH